jgi:EAL domain-containing protein (putative c-di-GMP-specific phosphodiesterase class I)
LGTHELGYGVLQGFFAGRPMPADQLFETAIDTTHRFQATLHNLTPT